MKWRFLGYSTLTWPFRDQVIPMSWLHTFIPALPVSHRHYVDAPTPYLIGLLTDSSSSASNNNSVQHFLEEDFDYANSLVIRVDNMKGTSEKSVKDFWILSPPWIPRSLYSAEVRVKLKTLRQKLTWETNSKQPNVYQICPLDLFTNRQYETSL